MAEIIRDGKVIKLTQNEKSMVYDEVRRETWLECLRTAMENNAENLVFSEFFDEKDFLSECMEEMEKAYYADDYDEKADEIVFDVAEMNDIWKDDDDV